MKIFLFVLLLNTHLYALEPEKVDKEFAKLKVELMATDGSSGINKADQELANKFKKYDHTKVVEAMLPLLREKKTGVAYLASFIILSCKDGLKPIHLEALNNGWGKDGYWLPNAVAAIDSEKAVVFLAEKFRANPQTQAQLDWALISLGEKSIPPLLKQFDLADSKKEKQFFAGFRFILEEMKGKGKSAIPHLLKIAESKDAAPMKRIEAAHSVGFTGEPIKPFIPRLKKLSKEEPKLFADVVDDTIIASAVFQGAVILADKVDKGADIYTMREIAMIGPSARVIGPRVVKWLDHPKWDHRVMAVRTLGAIRYEKATPRLIKLLETEADWRLAYAATQALIDLKSKAAVPALENTAKNHWFPIVRQSATTAIKIINGQAVDEKHSYTKAGDLVSSLFVNRDNYEFPDEKLKQFGQVKKQITQTKLFEQLKKDKPDLAKRFLKTRNSSGEGMIYSVQLHPYKKGMILAASAGEWCGSIQYVSPAGKHTLLLYKNLGDIVNWNGKTYIVAGMYHMGMNEGMLYQVVGVDGKIALKSVFALPGDPRLMYVTDTNKLVINSVGGLVVFSDEKKF